MVLKKEITLQIKNLLKENPQGLNITDIVKIVNINRNTAGRYLENLLVSGQVEMRRFGMAKIYALSQRVPLSALLSISSELVMQLDSSLRIIFANEPFLKLVGTDSKNLLGKNIEYTPVALVFDDLFTGFIENIREGIAGKEWSGEIALRPKDIILFCRIAPTVFEDGRKGVSVILEDITEQKRSDGALRESEDRYRKLVEISPDAIFLHREGKIIYANPAAFRLLGASRSDEILGKNVLDFIQPEFLEGVRKNIEKDLGGDITLPMELYMSRIDGTPVIVEGRGVRTLIEDKPAVQVAIRDITERKRAETALRESEGKLNAMLQSITDSMSMMNENLTILWANEPAKRYFGKNIIGKKCYEAYHMRRNSCEPYPCLTLKAFRDGKMHQHETTVIDSQGERRFFECSANVALRDTSGKPVAVLEISRDITDKKRAELALRESEEKYRTFIDRANDAMCVIQDGIVKMCNPRLTEFWGGPVDEILGRPFTDFVHPDALFEVIDRYKRRMAGESPPPIYQTILKQKDGSRFYAELNAGVISYEGKPANLVIIRDINERKKADRVIRESEERLRLLLDNTEDSVFMQDPEGRYLYFNATARYGVSGEKMLGSTPYDLLDKEAADRIVERVKNVAKTGQSIREETPLVWKGQTLWFSDSLSPLRDANDTITAVVTVSHNITDRKRTEMALRESEEKFQTLVTATGDIIWETDAQAHFVYVSPQVESIIGYKPDELIGHTPFEFLKPDAIEPNQKTFRMAIENKEKSIIYISHWIHKDGHGVYLESHAVPIYRGDGSFSGFIGIDRKKTL